MTVLLLHPLGLDKDCWRYLQFPEAVAPDFPGHGDRVDCRVPTIMEMADELAKSEGGPFHVVGVSMGGVVAQHLAIRAPARVRSLVLACTVAAADRTLLEKRAQEVEQRGSAATADSLIERWFPNRRSCDPDSAARIEYARNRVRSSDPQAIAASWRAVAQHNLLKRLCEITVPVTLVAGLRDSPRPSERFEPLVSRLVCCRLVILDCGHMPQLEIPEAFERVVRDHLKWASALERPCAAPRSAV